MDNFILGYRACQHNEAELQRLERREHFIAMTASCVFGLLMAAATLYSLSIHY